ncbi:MAG: glycosyltransferase family 4 protein, partial [Nitrospina sp.]|nr:glycosyltransferase family 4 protein [Nitrospina sp.]
LVGIVGRLVPIKNHILFLNMAGIFLEENPLINVKFVLVGDGELQNTLKSHAEKNGLTQHVLFCGWRRDLPDVYADLDILTLTSRNEGTPVSIIEAMAADTPVISTDAGGVQDLLGPESEVSVPEGFVVCERGILCRKNDATGFARGLKHLVEMDKSQKDSMVKNAKDFVDKTFSEKRLLHDMEILYLKMMTHHPGKNGMPGRDRPACPTDQTEHGF